LGAAAFRLPGKLNLAAPVAHRGGSGGQGYWLGESAEVCSRSSKTASSGRSRRRLANDRRHEGHGGRTGLPTLVGAERRRICTFGDAPFRSLGAIRRPGPVGRTCRRPGQQRLLTIVTSARHGCLRLRPGRPHFDGSVGPDEPDLRATVPAACLEGTRARHTGAAAVERWAANLRAAGRKGPAGWPGTMRGLESARRSERWPT